MTNNKQRLKKVNIDIIIFNISYLIIPPKSRFKTSPSDKLISKLQHTPLYKKLGVWTIDDLPLQALYWPLRENSGHTYSLIFLENRKLSVLMCVALVFGGASMTPLHKRCVACFCKSNIANVATEFPSNYERSVYEF